MKTARNIIAIFFIITISSCYQNEYKAENKILNFWSWFNMNKAKFEHIDDSNRDQKLDSILRRLDVIEKGLFVEVSDEFKGVRDIRISAGGDKEKFPIVKEIVKQAPKMIGWTFTAFRQRAKVDFTVKYKGLSFTPSKMFFYPEEENGVLNIRVYAKDVNKHNYDSVAYYGIIAMDNVLGEFDSAIKVGDYTFYDLSTAPNSKKLKPFKELPSFVDNYYKKNK